MIFSRRQVVPAGALSLLAVIFLPVAKSEAQLKIGIVDVNRAFLSSAKTKEAQAKINEAKSAATAEFNVRADAYKKAIDEVNQMNQQLEAPALSAEAKSGKARDRDEKIAQIKTMEREITDFRQTREQQLQQQIQRAKEQLVQEITGVVLGLAKTKKLDLVFDKSGASFNGFSPVLFSPESDDFTAEVIAALKKSERPQSPPTPKP